MRRIPPSLYVPVLSLALLSGSLVTCVGGSANQARAIQVVLFVAGVMGLLLYAVILSRRLRRSDQWERAGRCRECGYDRRHIDPTKRCPECGTSILPVGRVLKVVIFAFTDTSQPGWVAAEFFDASRQRWEFREKIPVLTDEDLWCDSQYPRPGLLNCTELSRPARYGGRIVRVRFGPGAPWPLNDDVVVEVSEEQLEDARLHPKDNGE